MGVKGLKNLDVPKVSGINQTSENFLEDRVPVTGIQLTENLIHILRNLRLSIKTFLKKTVRAEAKNGRHISLLPPLKLKVIKK